MLARRAARLNVSITNKALVRNHKEAIVVAIDSTGLSLHTSTEWNRLKHGREKLSAGGKWRKLHVAIDVRSGEILSSSYTKSNINDGVQLPAMLAEIDQEISAVCGDMAYDTVNCREAIRLKKAKQLIPPIRTARVAKDNRNIGKKYRETLHERDEAINGNTTLSRKAWKQQSGYHARSLVETTMWQIKSKVVNLIIAA